MSEAARARNRREWLLFAAVILGILLFLAATTRAEGEGVNYAVLISILIFALISALFALGLNLQFGVTGLINFGHVGSLLVGAYAAAIFSVEAGNLPSGLAGGAWPDWLLTGSPLLAVLLGALAAVVFGLLVGIPTLRLREDYLAILTISAGEILRTFAFNEERYTGGTRGLQTYPTLGAEWVAAQMAENPGLAGTLAELRVTPYSLFLFLLLLATIAAVLLLVEVLTRAPYGRVLRAIRDDEEAAAALGKNVFAYKLQVLVLGSVVGSLAGAFLAWYLRSLQASPDLFGPVVTFYAYISVVAGGAGSNKGTVLGTLLLFGLLFEGTRYTDVYGAMGLSSIDGSVFRILLIGFLLIAVMLLRPQGILGRKEEMVFGK